jgi:hypothetical protein
MLASRIDTHTADALFRLMQQYKDKPRLAALIAAFVDPAQDLESAIYALDAGRQLYSSVGKQLDNLGEIIGITRGGLSDAQYLIFLLGTIAKNNSDTTIDTMITLVQLLFSAQVVQLKEMYPAAVAFGVGGTTLDPALYPLVEQIIIDTLGAGISLVDLAVYDGLGAFAFAGGAQTDGGFGDVNDSAVGGTFASLIFNNPSQ